MDFLHLFDRSLHHFTDPLTNLGRGFSQWSQTSAWPTFTRDSNWFEKSLYDFYPGKIIDLTASVMQKYHQSCPLHLIDCRHSRPLRVQHRSLHKSSPNIGSSITQIEIRAMIVPLAHFQIVNPCVSLQVEAEIVVKCLIVESCLIWWTIPRRQPHLKSQFFNHPNKDHLHDQLNFWIDLEDIWRTTAFFIRNPWQAQ